jgi:hypothetical protein
MAADTFRMNTIASEYCGQRVRRPERTERENSSRRSHRLANRRAAGPVSFKTNVSAIASPTPYSSGSNVAW